MNVNVMWYNLKKIFMFVLFIFGGIDMCKIDPYHIREFDRQGCESWDEYCNLNSLNYSDIILDEDDDDDE